MDVGVLDLDHGRQKFFVNVNVKWLPTAIDCFSSQQYCKIHGLLVVLTEFLEDISDCQPCVVVVCVDLVHDSVEEFTIGRCLSGVTALVNGGVEFLSRTV